MVTAINTDTFLSLTQLGSGSFTLAGLTSGKVLLLHDSYLQDSSLQLSTEVTEDKGEDRCKGLVGR